MNFWIFAVALLVVPAAVISWPFLTGSAKERLVGLAVLLVMPLAGLLLYQNIGTPAAINLPVADARPAAQEQAPHASSDSQMDQMVASLQQRMAENPDDAEGWLILGRSLKTMQRYPDAESALANANRLLPDNPLIMVELAEASLFASGKPEIGADARQLIESALVIDPQHQKGLWLMGMVAAQDGDSAQAITLWQSLLDQLDPASSGADAVTQQIETAKSRMDPAVQEAIVAVPEPVAVANSGIPVNVSLAEDMAGAFPANAVLFVFMHPAGAVGMPLAVKRMAAQGFPMSLQFSDNDLLRPGMSLQDFEQIDVSARVSMSGIANAASGDIQADRVTLNPNATSAIDLHLDQRVP